ncbi:MAG TPA: hypothetical protein VN832_12730 [Stellaceae bacterium]|nr:hypothetical protein [Stellaceae bacterium]
MTHVSPLPVPPRVPAVEPELLSSAVFLFGEYLDRLAAEAPPPEEEEEDDETTAGGPEIETRAILDLFAEELGTSVPVTLTLYMRTTALFRLLAASPSLARLAMTGSDLGDRLSEDALLAAARLDLYVTRAGGDGVADFNAREFREALRDG